jgi:hypothetical protein
MHIGKLLLVVAFVVAMPTARAQQYTIDDITQSVFLYPDFLPGKLLYKDKSEKKISINYNTLFQQMIFVKDTGLLALDNIPAIDTVFIDTLKFVPVDTIFYEVRLQGSALPLFIKYETELTKAAPPTPYGGTSQTGAIDNLRTYRYSVATPYQLKVPDNYNLKKIATYYIKPGNRLIRLKNSKQVRELYPANEKPISRFIKENHIEFGKTYDMEKLVLFIGTLQK